jgi:hypothetical protein
MRCLGGIFLVAILCSGGAVGASQEREGLCVEVDRTSLSKDVPSSLTTCISDFSKQLCSMKLSPPEWKEHFQLTSCAVSYLVAHHGIISEALEVIRLFCSTALLNSFLVFTSSKFFNELSYGQILEFFKLFPIARGSLKEFSSDQHPTLVDLDTFVNGQRYGKHPLIDSDQFTLLIDFSVMLKDALGFWDN